MILKTHGPATLLQRSLRRAKRGFRYHSSVSAPIIRDADKPILLVIDSFMPFDDRSAGGKRLAEIMKAMCALGWHVVFISDDGDAYEPYASRLRNANVEVLTHAGSLRHALRKAKLKVELVWVCRPELLKRALPVLRERFAAPIVYDTVDLHYLRLRREEGITGKHTSWERMRSLELSLMDQADMTVVTSDAERDRLAARGIPSMTVPIVAHALESSRAFEERHTLLFLGNYSHSPNIDAATVLIRQIMPLVWERIPHLTVVLAGAEPVADVRRLASGRVHVPGFVEDLTPLFDDARLFVAPLRYGAGMKGKIVDALAHGLPVVTTPIGAEGIGNANGAIVVAEVPDDFSATLVESYLDQERWLSATQAAAIAVMRFSPERVQLDVAEVLEAAASSTPRLYK